MQLPLASLLDFIRAADPDARLELTRWGQPVIESRAVNLPTLLIVNPDVTVMTPERRAALQDDAA